MFTFSRALILFFAIAMLNFPAVAGEVSKEQMKGLDEQVQDIKSDVLRISSELNQLEEKLLYPSDTQVAVFVSLDSESKFRLDSMDIRLDGTPATHYLYSYKELGALQKGGVQRIYTGNLKSGEHDLQVLVIGKGPGGTDVRRTESFKFRKDVGPKLVEIRLAGSEAQTIGFKDH